MAAGSNDLANSMMGGIVKRIAHYKVIHVDEVRVAAFLANGNCCDGIACCDAAAYLVGGNLTAALL